LIRNLARRGGDDRVGEVADRILEQEDAAAELVAGPFERALDVTLGEPATSPLPGVTPIGKPSERADTPGTGHLGPQRAPDTPPDEPITDSGLSADRVDAPGSPPPGHPAGTASPRHASSE
jgi:hypothetical protein